MALCGMLRDLALGDGLFERWEASAMTSSRAVLRGLLVPQFLGAVLLRPTVKDLAGSGHCGVRIPVEQRVGFRRQRADSGLYDVALTGVAVQVGQRTDRLGRCR